MIKYLLILLLVLSFFSTANAQTKSDSTSHEDSIARQHLIDSVKHLAADTSVKKVPVDTVAKPSHQDSVIKQPAVDTVAKPVHQDSVIKQPVSDTTAKQLHTDTAVHPLPADSVKRDSVKHAAD